MNSKLNIIFSESGCPAEGVLQKYLHNELSHSNKHDVEKHLIDCEMCSDELEGLQLMRDSEKLNLIVERINNQIDNKTKVRILKPLFSFARIAAAILVIVIIGSFYIIYNNFHSLKNDKVLSENIQQVTANEQQKVETKAGENLKTDSAPNEEITSNTRKVIAENKINGGEVTKDALSKLSFAEKKEIAKETEVDAILDNESKVSSGGNMGASTMASFEAIDDSRNQIVLEEANIPVVDEKQKEETIADQTIELTGKASVTDSEEIVLNTSTTVSKSDRKGEKKAKSNSEDSFAGFPVGSVDSDNSKDVEMDKNKYYSSQPASSNSKTVSERERSSFNNDDAGAEQLLNLAIDDYTTEKYNEAKDKFEKIIENKNFAYYQKVQWYYALTLIKLKHNFNAKKVLNDIVNTQNHIYTKEAKELLDSL